MLDLITNFLASDFRTATPILLAAIGLVYGQRSGIVNIGAEGMMLTGSLAAVVGSYWFGNAWAGAALAMFSSLLVSLIFAYLTITIRADQVVVGTAINIFGLGITTSFARVVFGVNTAPPKIDAFEPIAIPVLSKIPLLGEVLFQQNALVYVALLLVPISHFVLFKTDIGLKVRAVGEHPKAADTVGINVYNIRYGSVLFSGLLSGLAGAYVSLGLLSFFTENMVAGRGFIALAAVVFGKYSPAGALGASLLFGAGEALQYRLQASGTTVPFQFLLMVPYVLTILALCGFVGRSQAPAASGQPYAKE